MPIFFGFPLGLPGSDFGGWLPHDSVITDKGLQYTKISSKRILVLAGMGALKSNVLQGELGRLQYALV